MKVLHVCLAAFYIDNHSYQENLLPKYHKLAGNDVTIIASLQTFDKNGEAGFLPKESSYINENDIPVFRINYKRGLNRLNKKLKIYDDLLTQIKLVNPDIIFVHGLQFLDMLKVIRYVKKNRKVKVFVDNHCDYSNSAKHVVSKYILHKVLWRYVAHKSIPYVEKFYGVLPARVDFLIDAYKIPLEKCELLVMGVDDDLMQQVLVNHERKKIREKYGISDKDFLIIAGGKIDMNKIQILSLMEAMNLILEPNIKLIVFGSVITKLKEEFKLLCNNDRIQYAGWLNVSATYGFLSAADLVVFPGLHSVLWEQAVGMGKPCIFKKIEGFEHIDLNGNAEFIVDESAEGIASLINDIFFDKDKYNHMKIISESEGRKLFSYKAIARKSIESK